MIHLSDLTKRFGKCIALSDLSFRMTEGRIYGISGRNGAGKTTMLRIISGLLLPDSGSVEVLGKDPAKDWSIRKQIGILEDGDAYFPELTASEFLWWVGRLRSLNDQQCEECIESLTQAFYLENRRDDLVESLSHGMRRKVLLASVFVASPKLLLLDEPTTGLDTDSVAALSKMLHKHRLQSGTAVIACHDRTFLESVCSDLINLEQGRMISHIDTDHVPSSVPQDPSSS